MSENNNGDVLNKDGLLMVFRYLPTGMILRCGAVCRNWSAICREDDLWVRIMAKEMHKESGLSLRKNIALNLNVIEIWKAEFAEIYGNDKLVKDIYMDMRRQQINNRTKRDSSYRSRLRIFKPGVRRRTDESNENTVLKKTGTDPEIAQAMLKFLYGDIPGVIS